MALGLRRVNAIVNKDKQYVVGKNMDDVAEFVGIPCISHTPLPPEELFKKWITVLRLNQRNVRQIPNDQMNLDAIQERSRPIKALSFHIFEIGDQFIQCAVHGCDDLDLPIPPPREDASIGEAIIRYGDEVIARLEQWWDALGDNPWQQKFKILHFDAISLHQMLDRCTWHSAQHARQIVDVLERRGIEADGILSRELLAGLPLPKKVWS